MENLIAYGEYPVIIDLETFIQQPNSFNDDVLNEKINYEFDSVKEHYFWKADFVKMM